MQSAESRSPRHWGAGSNPATPGRACSLVGRASAFGLLDSADCTGRTETSSDERNDDPHGPDADRYHPKKTGR